MKRSFQDYISSLRLSPAAGDQYLDSARCFASTDSSIAAGVVSSRSVVDFQTIGGQQAAFNIPALSAVDSLFFGSLRITVSALTLPATFSYFVGVVSPMLSGSGIVMNPVGFGGSNVINPLEASVYRTFEFVGPVAFSHLIYYFSNTGAVPATNFTVVWHFEGLFCPSVSS